MNQAFVIGNLTRDPKQTFTPGGTHVLEFGVATNTRVRDHESGGYREVADFVNCVMYGQRGQSLMPYLKRGGRVGIRGRLRSRSWEDKADPRRRHYRLELFVEDVELLGGHAADAPAAPAQAPVAGTPPVPPTPQQAAEDFYDEDIPF